ncbi:uncharacterized protein LOC121376372 [Gigantopelta aegis]|uniref:uncharacterized protein LOC121376372 n=1 Tax=Gigantopelta aegis TaxID=1735272 RepID=UPI001B88A839|nr:uncharacterized protein LOC121376372 [Gigantopelta aegis]
MRHLLSLHNCRLPEESSVQSSREGQEVHSGPMRLLQSVGSKTRRIPVHVKVYRNCFEHYAVISKDQIFCNRCTFVSLKHCFVMPGERSLTELKIVSNDFEGNAIVLEAENEETMSSWFDALQSDSPPSSPRRMSSPNLSPVIPRSPILQTLEESDEGE